MCCLSSLYRKLKLYRTGELIFNRGPHSGFSTLALSTKHISKENGFGLTNYFPLLNKDNFDFAQKLSDYSASSFASPVTLSSSGPNQSVETTQSTFFYTVCRVNVTYVTKTNLIWILYLVLVIELTCSFACLAR
jgi:hypothetical protein